MLDLIHLHPMVVHFPIALLIIGTAVDLLGVVLKREDLTMVGKWNLYLGAASLLLVVATGLLADGAVEHSDEAHEIMTNHKNIGIVVLALFAFLAIWRGIEGQGSEEKYGKVRLVLSIIGLIFMTYGASLGGRLVFEHGLGVSAPPSGLIEDGREESAPLQESDEEHSHGSHVH